jgi:hypothetical protein
MAELVNFETARKEIYEWLDHKKIRNKKREDYQSSIDNLISLVQDGVLSVNEDFSITHKLNFPIEMGGSNGAVTEVKYKPRIEARELREKLANLKTGDATDNRLTGYFCAISGQSIGFQGKLDTSDTSIANEIIIFFL